MSLPVPSRPGQGDATPLPTSSRPGRRQKRPYRQRRQTDAGVATRGRKGGQKTCMRGQIWTQAPYRLYKTSVWTTHSSSMHLIARTRLHSMSLRQTSCITRWVDTVTVVQLKQVLGNCQKCALLKQSPPTRLLLSGVSQFWVCSIPRFGDLNDVLIRGLTVGGELSNKLL